MTDAAEQPKSDTAPGDERRGGSNVVSGVWGYLTGLALAAGLSVASFLTIGSVGAHLLWAPAIPVALIVFAIAQMGVHLVFFLHITSGPDNTNNVLALAFGVLIVLLVITGSLWIMANLNHSMMPMNRIMQMQR